MGAINPNEIPSPADLRAAYDKAIAAFTLDELAKYLVQEEGFPLEDTIADMEAIQRQYDEKQASQ